MNGVNIYGVNIKPQPYICHTNLYVCASNMAADSFRMTNVTDVVTQGRNEPGFTDRLLNDVLAARHRLNDRDHNSHHHHCRLQRSSCLYVPQPPQAGDRGRHNTSSMFSSRTGHCTPPRLIFVAESDYQRRRQQSTAPIWRRRRRWGTLLKEEVRQGARRIPFSETNVRSFPTKKVPERRTVRCRVAFV